MRILVANDDGISSQGLIHLARMARSLGEVWVVAPSDQCSAMSQRISVFGSLELRRVDGFPVEGVKAFALTGTPADCVKVTLARLIPEKPDVVFSGINHGYNVGMDILYSGTVGVTMEAMANGIPAIAFSAGRCDDLRIADGYMEDIAKELMERDLSPFEVWNVNFPSGDPKKVKGILYDRIPSGFQYYQNQYRAVALSEGGERLELFSELRTQGESGSDLEAVLQGYISIGKLENAIVRARHIR